MALIYITGMPGAGKSATLTELRNRGYEAYGLDEDSYGDWLSRTSNEKRDFPHAQSELNLHDWFANHHWSVSVERISELAQHSKNRTVFLCGNASDEDRAWHLFDTIFVLRVGGDLLRNRLMHRTNNPYGKHPDELKEVEKWHTPAYYSEYETQGAIIIDGSQTVERVTDDILAQLPK